MRQHEESREAVEQTVRDITRKTRRHFGAEAKIRIVLQGLRGDERIAAICRREGLHQNLYYRWSNDVLEAGKKRLNGDTVREAGSDAVKALRTESTQLKEALAEALLENRLLKQSVMTDGEVGT